MSDKLDAFRDDRYDSYVGAIRVMDLQIEELERSLMLRNVGFIRIPDAQRKRMRTMLDGLYKERRKLARWIELMTPVPGQPDES